MFEITQQRIISSQITMTMREGFLADVEEKWDSCFIITSSMQLLSHN